MTTNLAPSLFLEEAAKRIDVGGARGPTLGIGSVAGVRGRANNYIYGSAKAGFFAYLSGMRQKYARRKVQVVTVEPGFVGTAMTTMVAGKRVYYDLRSWRVMTIIKIIPERIFFRMMF